MELNVYWTQFAEDKLQDIFNYYKEKAGIRVAQKLLDGIIDASLELYINPEGKQSEELLSERIQDFRYLVYKSYKIVYWIDKTNKMILVSNIFDTRQNPNKINIINLPIIFLTCRKFSALQVATRPLADNVGSKLPKNRNQELTFQNNS